MTGEERYSQEKLKYLELLSEQYPGMRSAYTEIINLMAILNLPKGTEHFMSDLHGEYEAFCHILNNCSGVIREKVDRIFSDRLSTSERRELCTLIYYPKEKLELIKRDRMDTPEWYRLTLTQLIELSKLLASKYTRSKVRKALPHEYAYIIDELLHAQPNEEDNRQLYHEKILETIIGIQSAEDFIISLSALIKRLAVDHLHIVGDIFDRGAKADEIIELLMNYHSLDIEWGNHDILWMGAAAGSEACIATVIRNNVKDSNTKILENGYGISLRRLGSFADKFYGYGREDSDSAKNMFKAISVILFKLEGQIIKRHPEYEMEDRLLLDKVRPVEGPEGTEYHIELSGKDYRLKDADFPTVDPEDPYALIPEETEVMAELRSMFESGRRLKKHIEFLYSKGSLYCLWNDNLLFHGCMPLDEDGNFAAVSFEGKIYKGKAYFDYAEKRARQAYFGRRTEDNLDFMWYLWGGRKSPLCGRNIKTFEKTYIEDESMGIEESDPYYSYSKSERTCGMILREFGLYSRVSHIINGHTPVRVSGGESPIKAGGKLIVIDGGFCRAYHKKTGIAGYTLIYNSHGLRIKAHKPFEGLEKALTENLDIESGSDFFESEPHRIMVADTDNGKIISEKIKDLQLLLSAYREGVIVVEEDGL